MWDLNWINERLGREFLNEIIIKSDRFVVRDESYIKPATNAFGRKPDFVVENFNLKGFV